MIVRAPLPPAPRPRSRTALRAALLGGALCVACGRADAQAFDAAPSVQPGNGTVTFDRATPGVETITIASPSAIIDWKPISPTDPFVFLPSGNVATFQNGRTNSDFVVLNRILTNVPSRFDGTVISRLVRPSGAPVRGGTILFASPGGIILGPKAVFDVGSLVLTTLNVVDDGAGNFFDATGTLTFNGGGDFPNAAIVTMTGSQIEALSGGSYVAMVAPRIEHGGSVRVNGSAAYIAGEALTLRVNQGLFDIVVETGSANATPILHTGSTGGPASSGTDDVHGIYMVAVPKNEAITAVLQGDVGFDPAVSAAVENGVIVLSAGFNVVGGRVDQYGQQSPVPSIGLEANFAIRGGIMRSDVFGTAATDMTAGAPATGTLRFLQDVSLFGGTRAHLYAGKGQDVAVDGNALVSATSFLSPSANTIDLTGGEALIFAEQGGVLRVAGNGTVDASAQGSFSDAEDAGTGTGGTARVSADQASVEIVGNLVVRATGAGAAGAVIPSLGADGTGGNVTLEAANAGSVRIGGTLAMDASGTASVGDGTIAAAGATGAGGGVKVAAGGGGTIAVTGAASLLSEGRGGTVQGGAGNAGGLGQGGPISVSTRGGTIGFAAASAISATGFGGRGPIGGAGQGGDVTVEAQGGAIAFSGPGKWESAGFGGNAGFAPGGRGGDGTGGDVQVRARSAAGGSRITSGAIAISVPGVGGDGGGGEAVTPGGRGGDGRGGSAVLAAEAANGTIELGLVTVGADGTGGAGGAGGGAGGDGFGGDNRAGVESGPNAATIAGSARFAGIAFSSSGFGGASTAGAGGIGTGGSTTLGAAGAPLDIIGGASLRADGTGGPGTAPGRAQGGVLLIAASRHTTALTSGRITAGNVTGSASAFGDGGTGNVPGAWIVASDFSDMTFANLTLAASATGAPLIRPFSRIAPRNAAISVTGVAALGTAGEIRVEASGTGRILGGTLNLAAGDDVVVSHDSRGAGATVDVTAFSATGRNIMFNAGTTTRAGATFAATARDTVTIADLVVAPEMSVRSADIEIAATGFAGGPATKRLALEARPAPGQAFASQAVLGATNEGPGYTLTNAEAGRIRTTELAFSASATGADPARAPDVLVRDLSLAAPGAAQAGVNLFRLTVGGGPLGADGILQVEGALSLTNAGAGSGIFLAAGQRVQIVTPTGSVRVRDAAGMPGGTLDISSRNIWSTSQAVIDQLRADPAFAGRNEALIANDGPEQPRGYIEGAEIVLRAGDTLLVQNSGTATSFAGITVVGGTLVVTPTGGQPLDAFAFGRRINPDGSFVTNDAFFGEVEFGASGAYAANAKFNDCFIATGICPVQAPLDTGLGGRDPTTGPIGRSAAILLPPGAEDDDLVDTSFSSDALIEEPVTSGGESGLWTEGDLDCDRDNDGDCDEAGE